jgi:hypothetical protein
MKIEVDIISEKGMQVSTYTTNRLTYTKSLNLKVETSKSSRFSFRMSATILWTRITVTVLSETRTVFAHSNAGVMSLNSIQGMDVYERFFYVCAVLFRCSGMWSH